jgi:hypothetical protein
MTKPKQGLYEQPPNLMKDKGKMLKKKSIFTQWYINYIIYFILWKLKYVHNDLLFYQVLSLFKISLQFLSSWPLFHS